MSNKIIVIGGGISGLTAGIYARLAGFEVDIYEEHNVVGGMCAQWYRNGFTCPSAIHWMMGTRDGSDLNEIWKTIGALEQDTEIFTLDYISACSNGNKYCYLYADIEKLEAELMQISPQDENAIKELIREIKIYKRLPIPAVKPVELMEPMEKAITFAPYIKAEKQTLLNKVTVAEYVERFQSPIIRRLLLTVVPDSMLSANMLMIWLASNCNGNIAFPLDGFFAMAKRMEQKLLFLGGKIHTNTPVEKIVVKEGVATGIILVGGREINANYIIPTISPDVLLQKMLDNQFHDTYFQQRFTSPEHFYTPALTLVNLNIQADLSKRPHTLIVETKNPLFINNTKIKDLKINHFAFAPQFCKKGGTLLQVVIQEQEFEYWKKLKTESETAYKQAKEIIAMQAIVEIESVYPETRGKIEWLDVATPLTLQRYCHSYQGAYLSFSTLHGKDPLENHEGAIYGIKNMFLAGQWVFQNGGLPMAAIAGKFAVQRICSQENIDIKITTNKKSL